MADGVRSYSDEELQAILRRALERQAETSDNFGHDELVAAAREVGLDESAVERAIDEISFERDRGRIRDELRRRRREKWVRHLITYLAVVGGLLGLHALALVESWVYWVAFGWGIGLVLDTYGKLRAPTDEEVERQAERLNRKERRRAQAEARREAKRRRAEERALRAQRRAQRSEAGDHLERVIEEGVTLLLGAAAKKIREATEQMERENRTPDTEFGRYVARKRAEARGERPAQQAARQRPRVRVETFDDAPEEHELEERTERSRRERRR